MFLEVFLIFQIFINILNYFDIFSKYSVVFIEIYSEIFSYVSIYIPIILRYYWYSWLFLSFCWNIFRNTPENFQAFPKILKYLKIFLRIFSCSHIFQVFWDITDIPDSFKYSLICIEIYSEIFSYVRIYISIILRYYLYSWLRIFISSPIFKIFKFQNIPTYFLMFPYIPSMLGYYWYSWYSFKYSLIWIEIYSEIFSYVPIYIPIILKYYWYSWLFLSFCWNIFRNTPKNYQTFPKILKYLKNFLRVFSCCHIFQVFSDITDIPDSFKYSLICIEIYSEIFSYVPIYISIILRYYLYSW